MSGRYPFKKQDIRDTSRDMRETLMRIEMCMRANDYAFWEDLQNDVVDIARQIVLCMKGK